jgi:branched-chain amino acid transport system permease protein
MTINWRNVSLFAGMAGLLLFVGFFQSWTLSLTIVNLCLISAIMALGVNIQWGYAGLLNVGVMGFAALGGLAAVLVSAPPVSGAWAAGGTGMAISALCLAVTIGLITFAYFRTRDLTRVVLITVIGITGYFVTRHFFRWACGRTTSPSPRSASPRSSSRS